jgi:hypothetical protein
VCVCGSGRDTDAPVYVAGAGHAPAVAMPQGMQPLCSHSHHPHRAGHPTHIMETIEGTAVYPPSLMQHVNGLVIPPRQPAYTASYSCAKRCTYVPLGGLSNPQPVSIAGYTFHGHHFMTGGLRVLRVGRWRLACCCTSHLNARKYACHNWVHTCRQLCCCHPPAHTHTCVICAQACA